METKTTVESLLTSMLLENTGTHFLDSGGAYGRNWERNNAKAKIGFSFEEEPMVIASADYATSIRDIEYTISVYHYLQEQLAVDEVCERFNEINDAADNWDSEDFYGVSSEAEKYLLSALEIREKRTENSYNHQSNLSQVIQYTILRTEKDGFTRFYIVLQIHGGCDVRGGYTNAKLFLLENGYDYDGGYLAPEDIYGTVRVNGVEYRVSNGYDGYSLRIEEDEQTDVEINDENRESVEISLTGYFSE